MIDTTPPATPILDTSVLTAESTVTYLYERNTGLPLDVGAVYLRDATNDTTLTLTINAQGTISY